MKLIIIIVLFAFASNLLNAKSLKRRYFARENDINSQRYMLIEDAQGNIITQDLLNQTIEVLAKESDVTYYLHTQKNPIQAVELKNGQANLLANTNFDPKKNIYFVVHGWNNDVTSAIFTEITPALLAKEDANIFQIDWSGPANSNYISASGAVDEIGTFVGAFINELVTLYAIRLDQIALIGHSLGAHVAGNAGAVVKGQVRFIVGLDPASPLFFISNTENRLDPTDAKFVQVIHTCGSLLGFASSIGHADYYPNGGMSQPGCGLDLVGTCAHSRSHQYFAESVRQNNFIARECGDYDDYENWKCSSNFKSFMGGANIETSEWGDFFLTTGPEAPYGLGEE